MSLTNKPTLSALLSPTAADEFLTQHWPHRPYLVHGNPARFPPALRTEELASVQALGKCYGGNMAFTRGRKSDRMVKIRQVDPEILLDMGLTLSFENVGPYVPGAMEFLRGLERELGLNENTMVMSAFASPHQDGLRCHYDAQDLISIQLQGTKRFHYAPVRELTMPYGTQYTPRDRPYNELYAQAENGFPDDKDVEFETAEMKPGTVLFLPRATWHHTEADEPSLSLSIIIRPPTLVDCAVEQLRWLMLQDSAWRQPLYGATADGATHEKLHSHAARLLDSLPALVSCLSPEDLIGTPLPVAKRLDQISDKTRFQRIPDATLDVQTNASSRGLSLVTIRLAQSQPSGEISARWEIPDAVLAVFRWIEGQRKPFTSANVTAAFPGIPSTERNNILANLTRAQFIKMFWFANLTPQARVAHNEG
ncbi:MAG: JmjC domain-containing protein [Burkholderiales bacterium]